MNMPSLMIRETSAMTARGTWTSPRRMDAILIPIAWRNTAYNNLKFKQGIIGLEVKVTRQDFLNGLKSGQYEKYDKEVCGMYLVASKRVCKTSEIPDGMGHLLVGHRPGYGNVCICKRRPKWKEVELRQESMWRIIFTMTSYLRDKRREEWEKMYEIEQKIGDIAGNLISDVMRIKIKNLEPE